LRKNVFWGAGKVGCRMCKLWDSFGIRPDYIFDNNRELEGLYCNGIIISEKEKLRLLVNPRIFVTCGSAKEVHAQIEEEYGFVDVLETSNERDMISSLIFNRMITLKKFFLNKAQEKFNIYWDLEKGLVMGGVELWAMEMAENMNNKGYRCKYISTDFAEDTIKNEKINTIQIPYADLGYVEGLTICYNEIIQNSPCNVVCNFAGLNFLAACMAKSDLHDKVRIIAVIHGDSEDYYKRYKQLNDYVDFCLVVSSRIEQKMILRGMQKDKIKYLDWEINCEKELKRKWSKDGDKLQLGYAGRITVDDKRADLLLVLASILIDRNIDFQMNIAGMGKYSTILQSQIDKYGYQNYISLVGYVERKDIFDFWIKQDIMLSCSDIEGHSISQSEAMSAGAVPIITDVSGARDDVTEGYNGFIVGVGELEKMADKICFLYNNRKELEKMGIYAYESVYKKQEELKQMNFWETLLIKDT